MKVISTVLRHSRLYQVKSALARAKVSNVLVYDVTFHGGATDHTETYKGATYAIDFVSRLRVEVIVDDELADRVVGILDAACDDDGDADSLTWVMDISRPKSPQPVRRAA